MVGLPLTSDMASGRQEVTGLFWIIRCLALGFAFAKLMEVEAVEPFVQVLDIDNDLRAAVGFVEFDLPKVLALGVGEVSHSYWRLFRTRLRGLVFTGVGVDSLLGIVVLGTAC